MSVESRLDGRIALVTGAARRIGQAIALALAEEGADVVLHYHSAEAQALETCRRIRECGRRAWCLRANLSAPAEAEDLFARVLDEAGPLDVLVNNASIFPENTVLDLAPEDLHECVNLHAVAPLLLSRRFAAQARAGCIVNLLDTRVQDYDRRHAAYHLSKRMLMTLTSMLALEFAPKVRVNGVAPGLILAPAGQPDDYLERLAHTNPLNTWGAPEDIAAATLFLVKSRFVTGQIIYVDGGRHLKGRVYG